MKKKMFRMLSLVLTLSVVFAFSFTLSASADEFKSIEIKQPTAGVTYLAGTKVPIELYANLYAYNYHNYAQVEILKGGKRQYFENTEFYQIGDVTPAKVFKPKTAGTYVVKAGNIAGGTENYIYHQTDKVTFKVKTASSVKKMKPAFKVSRDRKGKAVINATNYVNGTKMKVYRATKKKGKYKLVKTVKGPEYVDKSSKPKKVYYYKVRYTVKKNGKTFKSKMSVIKKAKKFDKSFTMNDPVLTDSGYVKITWSKCGPAEYYEVARGTKNDGSGEVIYCCGANDTRRFIDKDVVKGKTYYYRVLAGGGDDVISKTGVKSIRVK